MAIKIDGRLKKLCLLELNGLNGLNFYAKFILWGPHAQISEGYFPGGFNLAAELADWVRGWHNVSRWV